MPTFKHPCLHCGRYIARDVARCPFCGTVDPFVAGRCPRCRAGIEDVAWIACPSCGEPLQAGVAPMPGAVPIDPPAPPAPAPAPPAPAPAAAACSACSAALAPGARFCPTCGTIVG